MTALKRFWLGVALVWSALAIYGVLTSQAATGPAWAVLDGPLGVTQGGYDGTNPQHKTLWFHLYRGLDQNSGNTLVDLNIDLG